VDYFWIVKHFGALRKFSTSLECEINGWQIIFEDLNVNNNNNGTFVLTVLFVVYYDIVLCLVIGPGSGRRARVPHLRTPVVPGCLFKYELYLLWRTMEWTICFVKSWSFHLSGEVCGNGHMDLYKYILWEWEEWSNRIYWLKHSNLEYLKWHFAIQLTVNY